KLGASALMLGLSGVAAAQSSVTLSGVIDTGVSWTNHAGNGSQSLTGMSDSILGVSNFGLSGKEDLGGGVNALFNLQAGFNPSSGRMSSNGTLFSRNAYVGLSSSAGTLTAGKQWNFNDDWLVGSVFKGGYNSGAIFKFSEFDAISEIYNNTLKYVSPSFGGAQFGAMYGFGEQAGSFAQGSLFNVAARYNGGPLYLAATYDQERDVSGSGSLYKLITVGGSYTFGAAKLRLGAARADVGGAGTFQSIPSMSARKATVVEGGVDYAFTQAFTLSGDVLYR
ncbi:porin, partial [Ralstonia soli]